MSESPTPDPLEPAPAAPPPADGPPEGPYRNLMVPLVVVPFLVVGVLVMVFLFFGAIRGRDATIEENLARIVTGGTNERKQAALNLASQVVENQKYEMDGREPRWEVGPDFLERLQEAWIATEEGSLHIRLALAKVLVHYEDPDVRGKLVWFLDLPDEDDKEGYLRFGAMEALSILGDPAAAPHVIPFLGHADPYLQQAAAATLQVMPGEASVEALKDVLGEPSLELRGMAAISLSHLGDPTGVAVLQDLIDPGTYERARASDPHKYTDGSVVQNTRVRAVQALSRLGRPQDRDLLEGLAESDQDPAVREAAMRALREREGSTGSSSG